MNRAAKLIDWFEREQNKDKKETELYKKKIISQIKKEKELIPEPKKITLWMRIRKVLIGY